MGVFTRENLVDIYEDCESITIIGVIPTFVYPLNNNRYFRTEKWPPGTYLSAYPSTSSNPLLKMPRVMLVSAQRDVHSGERIPSCGNPSTVQITESVMASLPHRKTFRSISHLPIYVGGVMLASA